MYWSSEKVWTVTTAAAATVTGLVVRKLVEGGWRTVARRDPPSNPADRSTGWGEAVLWGAALGAAVGVSRVVARRISAQSWRAATGDEPPL